MFKIKEKQPMWQSEELLKALGQDLSDSSTKMLYKHLNKLILKYRLKDASSCHLMNFLTISVQLTLPLFERITISQITKS